MINILKENGLKITKQRIEILELIDYLGLDATNKNIRENINIDISTMYRIIETFLKKNVIEKCLNYNNEIYYRINNNHVHYIECIKCHKKQDIDICPIEQLEEKGFKVVTHKLEIQGVCNECSKS